MRCLALAQAWQAEGGQVILALALSMPEMDRRLERAGVQVVHIGEPIGSVGDAAATIALARQAEAQAIVIDGYQFDRSYQRAIKDAGYQLLMIDDYGHAAGYVADLVLNQNLYADQIDYRNRSNETRLLLGTSYALLRREFWGWQHWQRLIPAAAGRLLVTLGGSDPDNTTLLVVRALRQADLDLDVRVVVGAANPHLDSLEREINLGSGSIELLTNVDDMPALMVWADLAVSAAGSTCWEFMLLGVPLIVVMLAENQRYIAESLAATGVAINAGWHSALDQQALANGIVDLTMDAEQRSDMSARARYLVDGGGARRVARELSVLSAR
jgi:UDP-2,4-diacetamido-2,4,6-trideoxy-beta-L-altropyranose hydrolase